MALPLIPIAIASGVSYAGAKVTSWFDDDDEPTSTGASVGKVALYAAAAFGAYMIYRKVRGK